MMRCDLFKYLIIGHRRSWLNTESYMLSLLRGKKGETDLRIRRGKIIRPKEESKPGYNGSKKNYIPVVSDREAQGQDSK